jgi:4-amino-4-deoxy-L-arabinose transferase-like glycosyltransferase
MRPRIKATASTWLLAALLAVSAIFTVLPLAMQGPAMFVWDDTEYVTQALNTFEHVNDHGLVSWPGYSARHQIVKPPLYVNTLTAALFVFGRERGALAAGMVGGLTIVLLGIVVFWLVSRVTNRPIGLAATAGMLALPCVSRWFPSAHPDAQLSVLALAAVGLLAVDVPRWSRGRIVLLGVTVGLGLLAKVTFLLFLVLPAGYWLLRGGAGRPPLRHRLGIALQSAVVAGIVASTWYITQGEGALYYARVSSGFQLGPVADGVFGRAQEWFALFVARGWGYFLVVIAAVGVVAVVLGRGRSRMADQPATPASFEYAVMLSLSALPMLVFAVWSRTPPNTRHPLASLILIAVAVLIFALNQVDRSRFRRALWPVCLVVIGLQFAMVTLSQFPPAAAEMRLRIGAWAPRIAPGVNENQPISVEAASHVLDRARDVTSRPGAPTDWYLSGNTAYVNVSRLILLAKLQNVRVNFLWGSYFTWSDADREAKRAEMRSKASVVILYEPVTAPGTDMADLNRHNAEMRAFVADPANGFEPLGGPITTETYRLSLFIRRPAS